MTPLSRIASPPEVRARLAASLLLAAACLFWAGNFVVGRAAAGGIPPAGLALWRWVVAGLVLAPFTARTLWAERAGLAQAARILLALGLLGVCGFTTLTYVALNKTEAINAALANSLIPLAILAAASVLDRERPRPAQMSSLALSLAGVAVVVARGDPAVLAGLAVNAGDLLLLVAVVAWALYTVLLRRVPGELGARLGPLGLLAATIVFGLPPLWLCRLGELAFGGGPMPSDAASLGVVAYTGLFPALASYLCWNRGLALIGPAASGPFLHLMPLFSAALAVPLLGEAVRPFHALGLVLILAGVAVAGRR